VGREAGRARVRQLVELLLNKSAHRHCNTFAGYAPRLIRLQTTSLLSPACAVFI